MEAIKAFLQPLFPSAESKNVPLLDKMGLILVMLLPFSYYFGQAFIDINLTLIGLLFLAHSFRHKQWYWLKNPVIQLSFLLWGYMVVRGIFTEIPSASITVALSLIRYILAGAGFAFWLFQSKEHRRLFATYLWVMTIFVFFDIFYQYVRGVDLFGYPLYEGTRVTGPVSRPKIGNALSYIIFPMIAVCLTWLTTATTPTNTLTKRIMGAAFILYAFLGIIVAQDRMALLLFLLVTGILTLFTRYAKWLVIAGVIGIISTIVLLQQFAPDLFARQVTLTTHEIVHFIDSPYGIIYNAAKEKIVENPIFGVGTRQFRNGCVQIYDPPALGTENCARHPHNIYLEFLAENGLIGFTLLMSILAIIARYFWQHRHLIRHNPYLLGCVAALFARLWPIASTDSFYTAWCAAPLPILIGYVVGSINDPASSHHSNAT